MLFQTMMVAYHPNVIMSATIVPFRPGEVTYRSNLTVPPAGFFPFDMARTRAEGKRVAVRSLALITHPLHKMPKRPKKSCASVPRTKHGVPLEVGLREQGCMNRSARGGIAVQQETKPVLDLRHVFSCFSFNVQIVLYIAV